MSWVSNDIILRRICITCDLIDPSLPAGEGEGDMGDGVDRLFQWGDGAWAGCFDDEVWKTKWSIKEIFWNLKTMKLISLKKNS